MVRYADPVRCPDCGGPIPSPPVACPSCGLRLTGDDAVELFATLQAADRLLERLRAEPAAAGVGSTPVPAAGAHVQQPRQVPPEPLPRPAPMVPPITAEPGLRPASVPRILLSLGALCLLVGAIGFLAVAWASLGVGGRTTVLVGLTVLGAVAAVWLGRRGLRIASEALTVVAFGLLALDLVGADSAGWLGELSTSDLVTLVGLVVGGLALAVPIVQKTSRIRPSISPQVVAGVGLGIVPAGLEVSLAHEAAVYAVACLVFLLLAALTQQLRVGVLPWVFGVLAGLWWLPLAGISLVRLADHATWRELWVYGWGWASLVAAALLGLAAWLLRGTREAWQTLAGLAAIVVMLAVAAPALTQGPDAATLTMLVFVLGWSVALAVLPPRLRLVAALPLLAASVVPAVIGLRQAAVAAYNVFGASPTWSRAVSAQLDPAEPDGDPLLLPVIVAVGCVALTAAIVFATRRRDPLRVAGDLGPFFAAGVAVAVLGGLAAYAVPIWAVPAGLLAVGVSTGGWGLRRRDRRGAAAVGLAGALGLAAVAAALPSQVLTFGCLAVLAVGTGAVAVLGVGAVRRLVAEGALAPVLALTTWTLAELVDLRHPWPEVLALLVAGATLLGDAIWRPSRRLLAWPGGALLVLASWLWLADVDVQAPEAYTLPAATALVVTGWLRMRRDPAAGSALALGPGLALATAPTLLAVVARDEAASWRAVLLGVACLVLVLLGVRWRWAAPLVVGAAVGAGLVLWEAWPYAAQVPPWLLITAAGVLLTVVGVTWESRLRNLRDATAYVTRLR